MLFKMTRLESLLSGELNDSNVGEALEIFGKYYAGYDTKEISDRLAKNDYTFILEKLNAFTERETNYVKDIEEAYKNDFGTYHLMFGSRAGSAMSMPTQMIISKDLRLLDASRIMTEYFTKKEESKK